MNSLKKLFALALMATSAVNAADMSSLSIGAPRDTVERMERADERTLLHQDGRFTFIDGDQRHDIQPAYVDSEIREIDGDMLAKMIVAGNKLELKALEGDEYALHLKGKLNGGGFCLGTAAWFLTTSAIVGAGGATGAVLTSLSAVGGPAAAGAVGAWWYTCIMPGVVATANSAGMAAGITVTIATAPLP